MRMQTCLHVMEGGGGGVGGGTRNTQTNCIMGNVEMANLMLRDRIP